MIYLDYCATTPVDRKVLATFEKVCLEYPGNSNSLHSLGVRTKQLENYATEKIGKILKLKDKEIIYTSGASESNNLAIKGICEKYGNRGKHIITTYLEHSSVLGPVSYLTNQGFEVDYVKITDEGVVDLEHLKSLLRKDTILVSICAVDSEIGLVQPIHEIANIIKSYHKCYLHVDCTQAIGKIAIDFTEIDLASISAHKCFGLKGSGLLIKNKSLVLEPLIHGGKSSTAYRSGTPAVPLMVAMMKALELVSEDLDKHYSYVKSLNSMIVNRLREYDKVTINSTEKSLTYVINFSLQGIKPETFVHALEEDEVYISTRSACAVSMMSNAVYAVTKNRELASSSLRISLSYLTSLSEIERFLEVFDICYQKLLLK